MHEGRITLSLSACSRVADSQSPRAGEAPDSENLRQAKAGISILLFMPGAAEFFKLYSYCKNLCKAHIFLLSEPQTREEVTINLECPSGGIM